MKRIWWLLLIAGAAFAQVTAPTVPGGLTPTWTSYTATLHNSTFTACTSAKPIECTMTAHGLPTGASTVWVAGGTGDWAGINGAQTVTWVSTTKYTIPVDGTGFAAFGAQAITARSWGVTGKQDVAAADDVTQDLAIVTLPAKWIVTNWVVKHSTRCTGPTTIKTGLGVTGSNVLFRAYTFDLDTAVADANLTTGPTAGAGANTAASTALVLSLISTGTNINTVTACVIDVGLMWSIRP